MMRREERKKVNVLREYPFFLFIFFLADHNLKEKRAYSQELLSLDNQIKGVECVCVEGREEGQRRGVG